MVLLGGGIRLVSNFNPKAKLMTAGRRRIFERMKQVISPSDRVVWVHCASLGEFEQGRPVIEAIRSQMPQHKILLTFFSSSGYEVRKGYEGVDYVFYLPVDTPRNARRFVAAAHPEIAVFIKYEYWLNYLRRLKRSGCRTFIVSAIFQPDAIFFKWYGGLLRRVLSVFERLFVQDDQSRELLASIGVTNVVVSGDTRFDRVVAIAADARRIEVIEQFSKDSRTFIAGSTWPADEDLVLQLAQAHPETKFIIVPHEIDSARISRMMDELGAYGVRYTECGEQTDLRVARVMIIDTIGLLSSAYQYADFGYIGGGFGVGIHNTLEAATFGLPIAFGPKYQKFKEAHDLIEIGAARSISNFAELEEWFVSLANDPHDYGLARQKALDYIDRNKGATNAFMDAILRS